MTPKDRALRLAQAGKSLREIADILIREAYEALMAADDYQRNYRRQHPEDTDGN